MSKTADKKFQIEGKYNRYYSEDFKKQKVKDLVEKRIRVKELCVLYGLSRTSVYKWLYLYSQVEKGTKMVVQMESEQSKTLLLLEKVAQLERAVGQKQMEIDYLNTAFEVASEELGFDVKKKYAHPRSNASAAQHQASPTP